MLDRTVVVLRQNDGQDVSNQHLLRDYLLVYLTLLQHFALGVVQALADKVISPGVVDGMLVNLDSLHDAVVTLLHTEVQVVV